MNPLPRHAAPPGTAPFQGPAARRPGRTSAYLAVLLLVGAALAWTGLGGWQLPQFGPQQLDYYNLLVGGFRQGSLALAIDVPAGLRDAPDPAAYLKGHPGIGGHDLSFYRGHFYTYYGVVPTVVLFWPFRLLTGHDLPLVYASLAFAAGALLLTAWLWRRVLRDHFPGASLLTEAGGFAVLSLAAGQWVLLRRLSIWEPSLIAGHCFLLGMLAAGYQSLRARSPLAWSALAGLCLGLATGSRPTLAVAALGLGPILWAAGRGPRPWRPRLGAAAAAGVPLAAIGLGLLWYNWARFGNPLELGLRHQLSAWNTVPKPHFLLRFLPYNFYLYFLANPQWGRYFPFVHPVATRAPPAGYYGYEFVYGALILCPALWWLAGAARLAGGRGGALAALALGLLGVALAVTPVILCFDTAAARYAVDFLPWWLWLALLAWAALEARLGPSRWRRRAQGAFALTALVSLATAFFCSADLHGILHFLNPEAEQELTGVFDLPTHWWEELSGFRGGPLAMEITFAPRPLGSVEPLLVSGVEYQRDHFYVFYQSDHVVRFCYLHPGEPVAMSANVTVEPGRSYPLVLEGGALYPPAGDPSFRGWTPAEVAARKHSARVTFDGQVVLSAWEGANEASPGALQVGTDASGFSGRRFAGTIAGVRRLGFGRPVQDLQLGGDFTLDLELPPGPLAEGLPLVEAGRRGRADIVGLQLLGRQGAPMYESYGLGLWRGPLLTPRGDGTLSLRIRLGPTLDLPADQPNSILARTIAFWQDGRPVWWRPVAGPVAVGEPIHLLEDQFQSTEFRRDYVGRVATVRRLPAPAPWRPGPFHALVLQVGGRGGGGAEPLLSTGHAGAADVLGVQWLPGDRAQLIYDHWDHVLAASAAIPWSDGAVHTLRIAAPALPRLGQAGPAAGPLRIDLDGKPVWTTTVAAFASTANEVAVGRNPAGASTVAAELNAPVLDLVQEP